MQSEGLDESAGEKHVNVKGARLLIVEINSQSNGPFSSVQSNETMKPSKLQRHSKTTHAHLKEKNI